MSIWFLVLGIVFSFTVIYLLFEIHAKLRELCIRLTQIQADIMGKNETGLNFQEYKAGTHVKPTRTVMHDVNDNLKFLTKILGERNLKDS